MAADLHSAKLKNADLKEKSSTYKNILSNESKSEAKNLVDSLRLKELEEIDKSLNSIGKHIKELNKEQAKLEKSKRDERDLLAEINRQNAKRNTLSKEEKEHLVEIELKYAKLKESNNSWEESLEKRLKKEEDLKDVLEETRDLTKENYDLSEKIVAQRIEERNAIHKTISDKIDFFKKEQDANKQNIQKLEEERKLELDKAKSEEQKSEIRKRYAVDLDSARKELEKNRRSELDAMRIEYGIENSHLTTLEKQKKLNEEVKNHKENILKYDKEIEKIELESIDENDEEAVKNREERINKILEEKLKEDENYKARITGLSGGSSKVKDIIGAGKEGASKYLEGNGINSSLSGLLSAFKSDANDMLSSVLGKAAGPVGIILSILGKLLSAALKIGADVAKGVDEAVSTRLNYYAPINARLATLDDRFGESTDYYQNFAEDLDSYLNTNASAVFKANDYIKNIYTLTNKGVAFNIEERALLETLKDKVVTTFDATNDNLLRLIRIQQTDVTGSQLGAQATLTEFFNQYYSDSSYMTSEYSNIMSTISEAMSIMSPDAAEAFNLDVQKWLGSLYSVGVSSQGIQTLATGINALATGNLDTFNSNNSLLTLFAAASEGSYGDLLNYGLDSSNIDDFMTNILFYLSKIADTDTLVTRQAMSSVFGGLNLADIRAIGNLNQESDLTNIRSLKFNNGIADGMAVASDLISRLSTANNASGWKTLSPSEVIDNMIYNLEYQFGESILDPTNTYGINALGIDFEMPAAAAWKLGKDFGGELASTVMNGIGAAYLFKNFKNTYTEIGLMDDNGNVIDSNLQGLEGSGIALKGLYHSLVGMAEDALGLHERADTHRQKVLDLSDNLYYSEIREGNFGSRLIDMATGGASSAAIGSNLFSNIFSERGLNGPSYVASGISIGSSGNLNLTNPSYYATPIVSSSSEDAYTVALANSLSTPTSTVEINSAGSTGIIRTASDIYAELFELQQHPIRVKLSSLEDESLNQLFIKVIKDNIDDIRNTVVDGSVRADIVDSDINSIVNNIYRIRTSSSW